jgi:hypothetical protein
MNFTITETQRLIAAAALASVSDANSDPVDDFVRAMVVIQRGGMQPYFLQGFKWSCNARSRSEPERIRWDVEVLDQAVEQFHESIDNARGQASRRIRGNRARRIKAKVTEARNLMIIGLHKSNQLRNRHTQGGAPHVAFRLERGDYHTLNDRWHA